MTTALAACLLLAGCSTQQRIATTTTDDSSATEQQPVPIHTVSVPAARATISFDGQSLSSRVAFSTTIDSLVIWSIQPIAGMELLRLEATPTDLVVFDKTTMEYIPLSYESLLPYSAEPITFQSIQDIATGAILPRGQQQTLRVFNVANKTIILDITYPEIRTNVSVNMTRLPLVRFNYKSLDQVLQ